MRIDRVHEPYVEPYASAPGPSLNEQVNAIQAPQQRRMASYRPRVVAVIKPRPLQPCAGCGEPSRARWCSDSCRRAEDGPQDGEC